ncbi:MAG: hypothetical protein HY904_16010 [Deltaproteobacteria bacterium]|nr:hypothetical protein [Deltaproteobacteria bacterium]
MTLLLALALAVGSAPAPDAPAPADPPADAPAPDGEDDEKDDEKDDVKRTPTPEDPQDIPLPRGYAPATPQPFLAGPALLATQYVAGLGARGLLAWTAFIPVVGLCGAVVAPALEAGAVTFIGDRVGPWRSALFWPFVAAYIVNLGPTLVGAALATTSELVLAVSVPVLLLAVAGQPPGSTAVSAPLVAGGALAAAGLGGLAAAAALLAVTGHLASPLATLLGYHLSRKPKRSDDNGADWPRLLPRGKGLPLPGFLRPFGGPGDDEEEEEERRSTPVSAAGGAA